MYYTGINLWFMWNVPIYIELRPVHAQLVYIWLHELGQPLQSCLDCHSLSLSHSLLLSLTFSYSLSFSLTLSHSLKRHLLEKNGTWKFCAEVLRISLNYVYYSAPQKNRKIGDQTQRIFQEFQGINISY